MSPAINVNLELCTCHPIVKASGSHFAECPGVLLLIPCPLQRSVALTVRLGRCDYSIGACEYGHLEGCAAYPVRVSCSISGKTWEESEVAYAQDTWPHETLVVNACRDRWALVKALVLHKVLPLRPWNPAKVEALAVQRDAVFAALSDMARAEDAAAQAQIAVHGSGIPSHLLLRGPIHHLRDAPLHQSPSASALASYVEHLIEQIGVLP